MAKDMMKKDMDKDMGKMPKDKKGMDKDMGKMMDKMSHKSSDDMAKEMMSHMKKK